MDDDEKGKFFLFFSHCRSIDTVMKLRFVRVAEVLNYPQKDRKYPKIPLLAQKLIIFAAQSRFSKGNDSFSLWHDYHLIIHLFRPDI